MTRMGYTQTARDRMEKMQAVRAGRKSIIDMETIDEIAKNRSRGMPVDYAAARSGIGQNTYHEWLRKGQELIDNKVDQETLDESQRLYIIFTLCIKDAESHFIQQNVDKIEKSEQWQASAWLLERSFRKHFGKDTVEDENDTKTEQKSVNIYLNNVAVDETKK